MCTGRFQTWIVLLGSGDESSKWRIWTEEKLRVFCSDKDYGSNVPTEKSCHGFTLIVRYQESDNIRVGPWSDGFVGWWERPGTGCWSHCVTAHTALGQQGILTSRKDWKMWPPDLELCSCQNYEPNGHLFLINDSQGVQSKRQKMD